MAEATRALRSAGVVYAEREADWLLEAASGVTREQRVRSGEGDVEEAAAAKLAELVARRVAGEPHQYVTGVAGFRRLLLSVGPGVFIPRPETELVAERAMERLRRRGTLVDVGTGSGAIALSVADERPDATVWATELSDSARAWATKNRDALGLDVSIVGGDLFENLPSELQGVVNVVVANPPYVPEREREFLPVDVAGHEPSVALYGSEDGFAVIRRVAAEARRWLRSRGWIVLEIGQDQGEEVVGILGRLGYVRARVHRDLTGRERIVEARR